MKPINAEPGKQGFQSALDQQQSLELMVAWAGAGWKDSFARGFIREHFGKNVHQRTIANLKKRLRPRYEAANADIDLPADWTDLPTMMRHSIYTQHLRVMHHQHDALRLKAEKESDSGLFGNGLPHVSYRTLRWESYVREYYEYIKDPRDIRYVAGLFEVRDIAHDYLETDRDVADIEAWLRHRPWLGGSSEVEYKAKIEADVIPALDLDGIGNAAIKVNWRMHEIAYEETMLPEEDRPHPDSHDDVFYTTQEIGHVASYIDAGYRTKQRNYLLPSNVWEKGETPVENLL